MKRIDLTNKRKGRLLIIGFEHSHIQPSGQKRAIWKARCDCGNTCLISTSNFTHGLTVSCGCYRIEKSKLKRTKYGESSFNSLYNSYIHRAKYKKLPFNLTKEEFREIVEQRCYYCNSDYSNIKRKGVKNKCNGEYRSNGIDRIDSSIGYTMDNIVSCCKICNMMKNCLPQEDFLNHINRIYNYVIERNIKEDVREELEN